MTETANSKTDRTMAKPTWVVEYMYNTCKIHFLGGTPCTYDFFTNSTIFM